MIKLMPMEQQCMMISVPPQALPPQPLSPMLMPPMVASPIHQPYCNPYPTFPYQYYSQPHGELKTLWIGDLQCWMDEAYVWSCFAHTGVVVCLKVMRNRHTGQSYGYGFIEFITREAAEMILQTYNATPMPNSEQNFKLNWAAYGSEERRYADILGFTIFVGDLASDVTDYMLQETFRSVYPSVKGAIVVTDRNTGRSKGYGFVRFGDQVEQLRAMTEMNGKFCSTRAMRIGYASSKFPITNKQSSSVPIMHQGDGDSNNTTLFVGGLDSSVSDDELRQMFSQFGELTQVKILAGKRCGFVQFTSRRNAEQALSSLDGKQLGDENIRISWGRNSSLNQGQNYQGQWSGGCFYGYSQGYDAIPSSNQAQNLENQWSGVCFYGCPQGYDSYGYIAASPVHNPYVLYGGYPGYIY